jgi:hypothetical protein
MTRMTFGLRRLVGLAFALSLVAGYAGAPAAVLAADPPLPAWDGSVDLYRDGVFTTQKSWLWCTAAGVQIVRNIVDDQEDHTVSGQRRYFNWMRERNKYTLPVSAGVDPQGWTAGLRHFVDDRYRLVTSTTFDNALRSAVKRLRLTGLPVALTVAHGNHGWILTGFAATEDPARTASFKVTSVRIVGPLYGLQSKNGYDMPPDTKLTPTQLKRFFTPWKYAPKAMIWDGRYVSIQPVPVATTAGAGPPSATPGNVGSTNSGAAAGPVAPGSTNSNQPAPSLARADDVGTAGSVADSFAASNVARPIEPQVTDPDQGATGMPAALPILLVVGAGLVALIASRTATRTSRRDRAGGVPSPG